MVEYTDAVVNRDEPIPVIQLPGRDAASSDSDSKRQRIKDTLSGSKLKHKLQDAALGKSESNNSLQDRLFAKYAMVNSLHLSMIYLLIIKVGFCSRSYLSRIWQTDLTLQINDPRDISVGLALACRS